MMKKNNIKELIKTLKGKENTTYSSITNLTLNLFDKSYKKDKRNNINCTCSYNYCVVDFSGYIY